MLNRPFLELLESRTLLSAPGTGWQLAFCDGFGGRALNTSNWTVATGARRNAINSPTTISVANGRLTITTCTSGGQACTGFLGTEGKYQATYGYFEARIAFRNTPGDWSAFWLQSPTVGAPTGAATAGAEIDIAEHRQVDPAGNIANCVESNVHWDGYGASEQSAHSGLERDPTSAPLSGFHTYAVLWTPTRYTFYIDGVRKWTTTAGISQRSEFIHLTSEVQNASWAGNVPANGYGSLATSKTKMIVDWVHVWQKPVDPIPNQRINLAAANSLSIPVTVAEQDGRTTTVSATSSNPALIPASGIIISGSGANRALTLTPTPGLHGTATITVDASDGVVHGRTTFTVTSASAASPTAASKPRSAGGPAPAPRMSPLE